MPISIIVGGQYGSEGKGKVSYFFSQKLKASAVVRVGGTNSGHIVVDENKGEFVLRILPTVSIDENIVSILPSGSYIDLGILFQEINKTQVKNNNLKIDPFAVIIDECMKISEREDRLQLSIGSTESGTGQAVIQRLKRTSNITFAKDCACIKKYICDTKTYLRGLLDEGKHVIIEGTQGFDLSPIHSKNYPYCTSRDTTAAGFLMESGMSPFDVENIIMVIRAFPIRVGGNSGPLENEISWERLPIYGSDIDLTEYTSATLRKRRVGKFDADLVKRAIMVNKPNIVVMNHLDYIDYTCNESADVVSDIIKRYIQKFEIQINCKINYIGTGKKTLIEL